MPPNPNCLPIQRRCSPMGKWHGRDRRPRNRWIVDFGTIMTEEEAALYEAPFEYIRKSCDAREEEKP